MNKATHTPAPWHYQEGSDKYTHIVRTGEISRDNPHVGRRFLCQLPQDPDGTSEANARLIAAAPDLLGALRFILAFYEPGQTYLDTNAWKQAEALARAAMAKAEVRSTERVPSMDSDR